MAYGNDLYYRIHWEKVWTDPANTPLDVEHMDRLYTTIMLAQVSANAFNAERWAPYKLSAPWVARYCPDVGDENVPILSRERYLEILRHIWLRGADTMQIFNAHRKEYPQIATEEVEDAVAVYGEVLAFRRFLDHGAIMNTTIPRPEDDGVIWSGLRLEDEAVVRIFTPADKTATVTLAPWPGTEVGLKATPKGAYYLLTRVDGKVSAKRVRR